MISNRLGAGGLSIAQNAGIETALIDHQRYPTREAFDQDLAGAIDSAAIRARRLHAYSGPGVCGAFQQATDEYSPSALPLYPGLHTHQRALDKGDSHSGATVHYVTGELDGGRRSYKQGSRKFRG